MNWIQEMAKQKEVEQKDERGLTEFGWNEIVVVSKYEARKEDWNPVLSELEDMCDGHFGRHKTAKHWIALTSNN